MNAIKVIPENFVVFVIPVGFKKKINTCCQIIVCSKSLVYIVNNYYFAALRRLDWNIEVMFL